MFAARGLTLKQITSTDAGSYELELTFRRSFARYLLDGDLQLFLVQFVSRIIDYFHEPWWNMWSKAEGGVVYRRGSAWCFIYKLFTQVSYGHQIHADQSLIKTLYSMCVLNSFEYQATLALCDFHYSRIKQKNKKQLQP